jgi:aminopeptidase N
MTVSGKVIINGKITDKSANEIKLHAKDLDINSILVNNEKCSYSNKDDELTIKLKSLNNSNLEIIIEYSAKITESMHGIYPAYPKNGMLMIGTQFESHHAREAFPCIDEPEAKATFDLHITSQAHTVLSNMPVKNVHKIDSIWQKFSFETTPKMSTYLLAFITGDLQKVSTVTNNGTKISVWSSKDHDIESLVFPLEVAVKTTEFLNDYFGVEYPLPKCDHVALPDFSSGAMENWGLITYREVALIADPETVSASTKEFIATVIAHEISHQWFGNLVTMKWWDDLWLNESFATLMEYIAIDAIYPDWNVMLSFASHDALSAFRRDILPGVQPVATEVNHPDEISTLFDPSIVYAKGARLLLMAYSLVGDRNFRKGLKNYFNKHAYSNTTGDDLWYSLSKASKQDVGSIMNDWIKSPGFPYITVADKSNGLVEIRQKQLSS